MVEKLQPIQPITFQLLHPLSKCFQTDCGIIVACQDRTGKHSISMHTFTVHNGKKNHLLFLTKIIIIVAAMAKSMDNKSTESKHQETTAAASSAFRLEGRCISGHLKTKQTKAFTLTQHNHYGRQGGRGHQTTRVTFSHFAAQTADELPGDTSHSLSLSLAEAG